MDLLTEKYRPKTFEDLVGNENVISTVQRMVDSRQIPNLILSGPPGTGKTTCAGVFCEVLLGKNKKDNVLELNASDDRGIQVIRDTISSFIEQKPTEGCAKVVLLDEADSMTIAAQQALRRTMEKASTTRFIFICNTLSKIGEAIQSRCAVLPFTRIANAQVVARLRRIADSEDILVSDEGFSCLARLSDGDVRQSINLLQSCRYLGRIIGEEEIEGIVGIPSPRKIESIYKCLIDNRPNQAIKEFQELLRQKYDPMDVISGFFRVCKLANDVEALKCVCPYQIRIYNGVKTPVQFYAMFNDLLKMRKHIS